MASVKRDKPPAAGVRPAPLVMRTLRPLAAEALPVIMVSEPAAWCIFHAGKNVINRTVETGASYRGRAIVAARMASVADYAWFREGWLELKERGQVDGYPGLPPLVEIRRQNILGTVVVTGSVNQSPSPWFCGPFAFTIEKPVRIPEDLFADEHFGARCVRGVID